MRMWQGMRSAQNDECSCFRFAANVFHHSDCTTNVFWFRKRDQTIAQSIVLMLFHKLKSIGSSDLSECSAEFLNFDS